jgi:hypothetical protein
MEKLKEVEKLIDRLTVLEKKKGAKLLVIKYRESVEKAEADRIAKEAAEKAEAERLAKEAADKAEAERLAKEAADKAEAERLAKEAADKAEADRIAKEAADKAEEMAEKLIAEAKDIIANARHEREVVNPKLEKLVKNKNLKELKEYLKDVQEIGISMQTMLRKFHDHSEQYKLKVGDDILLRFNNDAEEVRAELKKQVSLVSKIKRDVDSIKIDIKEEKEKDLHDLPTEPEEMLQPEEKYYDHQEL